MLIIYIDEISSSRTILPENINWSNFAGTFEIAITGRPVVTRSIGDLSDPIQLDAGNYIVIVMAFNGANPVARGQTSITVIA